MTKKNSIQALKEEIHNLKYVINILEKNNFSKTNNFQKLCKISLKAIKNNKKIIFFGNGGSAADSQHLATELTIKYKKKEKLYRQLLSPLIILQSQLLVMTLVLNLFFRGSLKQLEIQEILLWL